MALSRASDGWKSWRARSWRANQGTGVGAAQVFSRSQRLVLFAIFAALVVFRLREAWLYGRFFGEEGTIFFAYAWHRPAGEALWRSFAGYLNLGANGSTLLAAQLVKADVLSLERAPYLTMAIATAFQSIPGALILTGRSAWLESRWAVIASLLIIATAPMTEEVFANVLHIQFHLALCTALVLAFDVPHSRLGRLLYCLPLALAPLCGPGAIVLLPLFALRAVVDKDWNRVVQTIVLGAASALQLLVFYESSPLRGHLLDPATLANILFVRLAALPYFSAPVAKIYGFKVYNQMLEGGLIWWAMTAVAFAYFVSILALASRPKASGSAFWLITSGLAIGAVSFGAGMLPVNPMHWFNMGASQRYNFLPLTLLGFGLVALIHCTDKLVRATLVALSVLTVASGALTYATPIMDVRIGPDWRTQVAVWRREPRYLLAGWPTQWPIDLSSSSTPCAQTDVASRSSQEPTYCESRWAEFVLAGGDVKAWHLPPQPVP